MCCCFVFHKSTMVVIHDTCITYQGKLSSKVPLSYKLYDCQNMLLYMYVFMDGASVFSLCSLRLELETLNFTEMFYHQCVE